MLDDFTTGLKDLASSRSRPWPRESSFKADSLPFKVAGLADHMPVYYATLLWNALAANRREIRESRAYGFHAAVRILGTGRIW